MMLFTNNTRDFGLVRRLAHRKLGSRYLIAESQMGSLETRAAQCCLVRSLHLDTKDVDGSHQHGDNVQAAENDVQWWTVHVNKLICPSYGCKLLPFGHCDSFKY